MADHASGPELLGCPLSVAILWGRAPWAGSSLLDPYALGVCPDSFNSEACVLQSMPGGSQPSSSAL